MARPILPKQSKKPKYIHIILKTNKEWQDIKGDNIIEKIETLEKENPDYEFVQVLAESQISIIMRYKQRDTKNLVRG
jgi:hypothetical protein